MIVSYQLLELKLQHGETQILLEMLVHLDITVHLVRLDNQLHAQKEHILMPPLLLL
jgi:hypothetical protein